MATKFIIVDNKIIMGNVEFHAELVKRIHPLSPIRHGQLNSRHMSTEKSQSKPIGGGRFHWNKEQNVVYFYDQSFDFGPVTRKQFYDALPNSRISPFMKDCELFFSSKNSLSDAMKEYDEYKACKTIIELKTWPQYYTAVKKGTKTFEVRNNDRNFTVGDILLLKEYIPAREHGIGGYTGGYTGDETKVEVTYVLKDYEPLNSEYVVLGIKIVSEPTKEKMELGFKVSKEMIKNALNSAIAKTNVVTPDGQLYNDIIESMVNLFN